MENNNVGPEIESFQPITVCGIEMWRIHKSKPNETCCFRSTGAPVHPSFCHTEFISMRLNAICTAYDVMLSLTKNFGINKFQEYNDLRNKFTHLCYGQRFKYQPICGRF